METNAFTPKVIIYCRVSSRKQVTEGNGLDSQEQQCRAWARTKGYPVENVYIEPGMSGSDANRPVFNEMLNFLRHVKTPYIVLAYDINRFARNAALYATFRQEMKKHGHLVQSVTMQMDETAESELIEYVSAAVAQYERQKNKDRTKTNMIEHAKQGYWVLNAPVGYKKVRTQGRVHWVRLDPTATFIQEALEGFAYGRLATQKAVMESMRSAILIDSFGRPIQLTLNFVKNMLKNEKYTGWFGYPQWGIPYQQWHIEPIISIDTFQMIQDRLHGKKSTTRGRKHNMNDEAFPLRRWVLCATCGRPLTADKPRGKCGKRYMYYHCYNKNCPMHSKSIRRDDLHADMESLLRSITPDKALVNLARGIITDTYNKITADTAAQQKQRQTEIAKLHKEKDNAFNLLMNSSNDPQIANMCREHINTITGQITRLESEITATDANEMPLDYALDTVCEFLIHPVEIWRVGDLNQKRGVLTLCFPNKLSYDKQEKFRTPKLSPVFAIFNENLGDFDSWRAQKDSNPQPSDP